MAHCWPSWATLTTSYLKWNTMISSGAWNLELMLSKRPQTKCSGSSYRLQAIFEKSRKLYTPSQSSWRLKRFMSTRRVLLSAKQCSGASVLDPIIVRAQIKKAMTSGTPLSTQTATEIPLTHPAWEKNFRSLLMFEMCHLNQILTIKKLERTIF